MPDQHKVDLAYRMGKMDNFFKKQLRRKYDISWERDGNNYHHVNDFIKAQMKRRYNISWDEDDDQPPRKTPKFVLSSEDERLHDERMARFMENPLQFVKDERSRPVCPEGGPSTEFFARWRSSVARLADE